MIPVALLSEEYHSQEPCILFVDDVPSWISDFYDVIFTGSRMDNQVNFLGVERAKWAIQLLESETPVEVAFYRLADRPANMMAGIIHRHELSTRNIVVVIADISFAECQRLRLVDQDGTVVVDDITSSEDTHNGLRQVSYAGWEVCKHAYQARIPALIITQQARTAQAAVQILQSGYAEDIISRAVAYKQHTLETLTRWYRLATKAHLKQLWDMWLPFDREHSEAHRLKDPAISLLQNRYRNQPGGSINVPNDIITKFQEIASNARGYTDKVQESQPLFRINEPDCEPQDAFIQLLLMAHLPLAFAVACHECQTSYEQESISIQFDGLDPLMGLTDEGPQLRFVQNDKALPGLVIGSHSITQAVHILCANLGHAYPPGEPRKVTIGWEGRTPDCDRIIFKFRDHGRGIQFNERTPLEWYRDAFSGKGKESRNKLGHLKTILELHNGWVEVVTSTFPQKAYLTKTRGLVPVDSLEEADGQFLPSQDHVGTCFRLVMEPLAR